MRSIDSLTVCRRANSKSRDLLDKAKNSLNSAAGGGKSSEKDEDYLDKGVDYAQETFGGGGKQNNER